MEGVFSKQLCGFRKGHSTQHCLLVMLEKIWNTLDNKGARALLLTDLSKAFDCIRHDLLIAKLHSYGFDGNALQLMFSYMSNRRQRTKINSTYSTYFPIFTKTSAADSDNHVPTSIIEEQV